MKSQLFKTFIKFTIVIAIFIITACGCSKISDGDTWNPELPPITQTGANTFGCKINGEVMVPRDSRFGHPGGGVTPTGVTYGNTPYGYDWIKAVDRYTSRGAVAFKLPEIQNLGVGEYLVKNIEAGFATTYPNIIYMQAKYNNDLYGSIEGTGKIIITRYDNEVISGTFYCKLKGYNNPNDIIEITEGRFDFNKSTIDTKRFR